MRRRSSVVLFALASLAACADAPRPTPRGVPPARRSGASADATSPSPEPAVVDGALLASCFERRRGAGSALKPETSACVSAKTELERRCATGDHEACELRTILARTEEGLHIQTAARLCAEQSTSVCRAACDGGDLDACVEVATMSLNGARAPRDLDSGAKLLADACARGSARACFQGGAMGLVLHPREAWASLRTVCDRDDTMWSSPACRMAMTLLDRGEVTPPLEERIDVLERACAKDRDAIAPSGACGRLKDLAESAR